MCNHQHPPALQQLHRVHRYICHLHLELHLYNACCRGGAGARAIGLIDLALAPAPHGHRQPRVHARHDRKVARLRMLAACLPVVGGYDAGTQHVSLIKVHRGSHRSRNFRNERMNGAQTIARRPHLYVQHTGREGLLWSIAFLLAAMQACEQRHVPAPTARPSETPASASPCLRALGAESSYELDQY